MMCAHEQHVLSAIRKYYYVLAPIISYYSTIGKLYCLCIEAYC